MKALRFLIAEDHPFQRDMLEQALRGMGAATVHCASNGADAMRVLLNPDTPVDIVITDLMMPDVDGLELIGKLRKSAHPVSLVLASSSEIALLTATEIAKGAGVPVLGALAKPLTPAALRPLIDRYLAAREGPGPS